MVDFFDTEMLEHRRAEMYVDGFQAKLERDTSFKGLWSVSFVLREF